MIVPHILHEAARHGISITLQGDRLKLASAEQPPAPVVEAIRRHRDDIVAHLKGVPDPRLRPPQGSLVSRLCAAGATVRTWGCGDRSQVELPAGISAELLREVEARGWRIIPGGRANPEAVHDSWLAGVPIAALEP
jgi:hypothetical protein